MSIFHNKIYTITKNIIDQGEEDAPTLIEPLPTQTLKFRLFDDDGELYFEGVMVPTDSERLFYPQDTIGASYGCTETRVLNDKGKWETV